MRLKISKSKNAISYYVIESIYVHGKRSTRIVEKIGTHKELQKEHEDPEGYARKYVEELNQKHTAEKKEMQCNATVLIKLNANIKMQKDYHQLFNGGYLFLQDVFYELGLDKICEKCSADKKIEYDLCEILSRLIYSRILYPGSKVKTYEFSQRMIEPSSFEQHDIYRALSLLSDNSDLIQSELYKNTKALGERNDAILYYDCTNYYFEIEQEDEFRKYGYAKSHKPNPIVEMGLFMDTDGIPLAFSMHPGNTNEQITLTPLEEKLEKEFNHSKFVVCTDAGLSSKKNRLFNDQENKAFITTQSVKQLSADLQEWALDKDGWMLMYEDSEKIFNLNDIENEAYLDTNGRSVFYNKILYKERRYIDEIETVDESGIKKREYINERLIITYSLKYRDYLRYIRKGQIERAAALINSCTNKNGTVSKSKTKKKYRQTDFRRFIESTRIDLNSAEVLENYVLTLRQDLIDQEEKYDGFYGVATNLDDAPATIVDINKKRWEIEECFRIIKTDFNAEPVFLSREDRIKAHFLTCFLALIVYRYLEKKVSSTEHTYTVSEIINELKNMDFLISPGYGYIPTYTRTDFTDRLHQVFGFRTDYQIIPLKNIKKIIQKTKS